MVSSTSTKKIPLHWSTIGGVASLEVLEDFVMIFVIFKSMFYTNTTLDNALTRIGIGPNHSNTNTILDTGLV